MTSPFETARTLVHAATSGASTAKAGDELSTTFDIPTLEAVFRFATPADRLTMTIDAARAEMLEQIHASNASAARASALLIDRLTAPRQRRYREGPNGLEFIEI
jgi:hypothetical protein